VTQKVKHWLLLVCSALGVVVAYASTGCYCNIWEDSFNLHMAHIPNGCVIFTSPDFWRTYDGEGIWDPDYDNYTKLIKDGDIYHVVHYDESYRYYELRQSSSTPNAFLIALRGQKPRCPGCPVTRYSANKFQFRWPDRKTGQSSVPQSVRLATEVEWDQARILSQTVSIGLRDTDSHRQVLTSAGGRYEVSWSAFGGPFEIGSGFINPRAALFSLVYNPPYFLSFNIVDSSPRESIARFLLWGCYPKMIQYEAWHGDAVRSIPLTGDQRSALLCRSQ